MTRCKLFVVGAADVVGVVFAADASVVDCIIYTGAWAYRCPSKRFSFFLSFLFSFLYVDCFVDPLSKQS